MGRDYQYDVILADPPWDFKTWSEKGQGRSASRHYKVMNIEAICALPVAEIAAENCVLFLWTTWPTIYKYPPRVFKAWGFTYRTEAWVWVKPRKDYLPQTITVGSHIIGDLDWAMGTGYYTRANSEPCLIAVKGRMPVTFRDVIAIICSPRREHSRKPDEQYNKIERLYPGLRYIELFARTKRLGWHAWGDEIESDIDLEAL